MPEGGETTRDGAHGRGAGWSADWQSHREDQRRRWADATPQQRLDWLEEALEFAARAGALPASDRDR